MMLQQDLEPDLASYLVEVLKYIEMLVLCTAFWVFA